MLPSDDVSQYQVVPHDTKPNELMLDHKPNGECIYLDQFGCTIHERRPQMCREMDCRLVARALTYTQARKLHNFPLPVWKKGRELLRLVEVRE